MSSLSKVFALNRDGLNWPRAVVFLAVALVPLVVLLAIGEEQYLFSAIFGLVYSGASDPGGSFGHRASRITSYALIGAGLTALGFAIGVDGWGWIAVATFLVTLAAGLAIKFGVHRFVAGVLLNVWFLTALSLALSYDSAGITSHTWAQMLAWLAGSALWIAVTFIAWLARGRSDRPEPVAEIPGDVSARKLTPPLIMFAVLRALAAAITVAIAFGLDLAYADWMPIAALVAMKPSLDQSTLVAEQRLAGALIGAVLAAVLLLIIDSEHALEAIAVLAFTLAGAIRFVNYALYCGAIAAGVLIAIEVPHPSNLGALGDRVLFTLIGVGMGVLLMFLADLLTKRKAQPQSQTA